MEKVRLYIDMDGTLSKFTPVDTIEVLYQPGYFYNLEPQVNVINGIRDFINNNKDIDCYILSSVLDGHSTAIQEKTDWLNKFLPEIERDHMIFPLCSESKSNVIPKSEIEDDYDILLDDYSKNLHEWRENGCIAIKLKNYINGTKGSWNGNTIQYNDKNFAINLKNKIEIEIKKRQELEKYKEMAIYEKISEDFFKQHLQDFRNVNASAIAIRNNKFNENYYDSFPNLRIKEYEAICDTIHISERFLMNNFFNIHKSDYALKQAFMHNHFSDRFFEMYKYNFNNNVWTTILDFQNISKDVVLSSFKFLNEKNQKKVISNYKFTEDELNSMIAYFYSDTWNTLMVCQTLTEDFIQKHYLAFKKETLFANCNVSKKFIKTKLNEFDQTKWERILSLNPYIKELDIKDLMQAKERLFAKTGQMLYNVAGGQEHGKENKKGNIYSTQNNQRNGNNRWHRRIRTIGKAYSERFIKEEKIDFIGEEINSPAELAELLWKYRSPEFETVRHIFLKEGKVVAATGVSNSISDMCFVEKDIKEKILEGKSQYNADSFFIVHNHPSGDPTPSLADMSLTSSFDKIPGFRGHIVLNHTRFSFIKNGKFKLEKLENSLPIDVFHTAEIEHPLLNTEIRKYGEIADLGKLLQKGENISCIVKTGSNNRIREIQEVSNDYLISNSFLSVARYYDKAHDCPCYVVTEDQNVYETLLEFVSNGNFEDVILYNQNDTYIAATDETTPTEKIIYPYEVFELLESDKAKGGWKMERIQNGTMNLLVLDKYTDKYMNESLLLIRENDGEIIIANNYDNETKSWGSGAYYGSRPESLRDAVNDFDTAKVSKLIDYEAMREKIDTVGMILYKAHESNNLLHDAIIDKMDNKENLSSLREYELNDLMYAEKVIETIRRKRPYMNARENDVVEFCEAYMDMDIVESFETLLVTDFPEVANNYDLLNNAFKDFEYEMERGAEI